MDHEHHLLTAEAPGPRAGARAALTRALTVAALGWLSACDQPVSTPLAGGELQQMRADQVVFEMQSYITTSGVREGSIEADTAYVFRDSAVVELRGLEVTFYDEEGRARATVTGRTGDWNQGTDQMVARGDVVLFVHQDNSRLESQEIHYDPAADRIWSDSATTRIDADGAVTHGSAFESDLDFSDVRILNVRGGGPVY